MAKFLVLLVASILSIEMLTSIRNDGIWQTVLGEKLDEYANTDYLTSKDDVNPQTPNTHSEDGENERASFDMSGYNRVQTYNDETNDEKESIGHGLMPHTQKVSSDCTLSDLDCMKSTKSQVRNKAFDMESEEHYIAECRQDDPDCVKSRKRLHNGEHQNKRMDVEFDNQNYKVEGLSQEDLSTGELRLPFSLDVLKDKLAIRGILDNFPNEDFLTDIGDGLTSRERSFRDYGNESNSITKEHGSSKWERCYSTDPNLYMGFAAMTPYNATAKLKRLNVIPKGCQPKHIWLLLRPGSYSANKADMARFLEQLPPLKRLILKAHSMGKGKLCPQDVSLIRTWKRSAMRKQPPGTLTPLGYTEIAGIAERFSYAFPDLMIQPLKVLLTPQEKVLEKPAKGTKFAFAPSRQTQQSTLAFIRTLYGEVWGHLNLPKYGLPILQFLDKCKKFIDTVLMKPKEAKPYHTFMKGKEMKNLLERVSGRLGTTLSVTKIRTMYNACRYQMILYPYKLSPWCVAFTERDLKVLEYWEDLRMHYDHGYAHQIAYKPACVLSRDILVNFLRRIKCNITDTNATVYFVNTEEFLAFTTLFGFFKDPKNLSEMSINATRVWRTSRFAGFGSNFVFILSSCTNNTWWVSAAHNEAPIQLPGCEKPFGCSFKRFFSLFGFEDCNFIKICGRSRRYMWQSKAWHHYYSSHDWM